MLTEALQQLAGLAEPLRPLCSRWRSIWQTRPGSITPAMQQNATMSSAITYNVRNLRLKPLLYSGAAAVGRPGRRANEFRFPFFLFFRVLSFPAPQLSVDLDARPDGKRPEI